MRISYRRKVLSAAAALVVCVFALGATSAPAASTHKYLSSFSLPAGAASDFYNSVAVDNEAGAVYYYAGSTKSLYKFDAAGEPANFAATGTSVIEVPRAGRVFQLAVDNSNDPTDPAKGDIYIANGTSVLIYDARGKELGELNGNVETEVPGTRWAQAQGVAVDRHGNVYVGIWEWVNKYSRPASNPIRNTDYVSSLWGMLGSTRVTVDGQDDAFVRQQGQGRIDRFEQIQFNALGTSAVGSTVFGEIVGEGGGLTSDQMRDRVYIGAGSQLLGLNSAGEVVEHFVPELADLTTWDAISVDEADGDIYALDRELDRIDVFSPAVVVPDVTTDAPSLSTSSVTLNGTVKPDGLEAGCYFEYGTDSSYGQTVPCASAPGSGSGAVAVHAEVSGLSASTVYHYRLVATNSNGSSDSEDRTFALPFPPAVEREWSTDVRLSTAAVEASISPAGYDTTFRVDYGTDTSYGSSVPVPEADIGFGVSVSRVRQLLTGLQPGTIYHYRVVASNANGSTEGPDKTFVTFSEPFANPVDTCPNATYRTGASQGLPDCRAFEMVSPVDKSGADVWGGGVSAFQASLSGEHVEFPVRTAFGDAKGTGGLGYSQFVASRTPTGWVSKGITPTPATNDPLMLGLPMTDVVDFSGEFERSVVSGYALPGVEGAVPDNVDLYLENPIEGKLLEAITNGSSEGENLKLPAGARTSDLFGSSSDMKIVTFGTQLNLVPQAKGSVPKIYALENGVVTLVGILPDGKVPSAGSYPARGEYSEQERSVRAAVQYKDTVSRNGSHIFFMASASGGERQLYLRKNGAVTVLVSQSEGSVPTVAQSVRFQGATPDGTKVLFSTTSRLSDSDPGGAEKALYMYTDSPNPETEPNLTFIARTDAEREFVRGISEDGSHIYFPSHGALLLWDDGQTHQVAPEPGVTPQVNGMSFLSTPGLDSAAEQAIVTPDGRKIAFINSSRLTNNDIVSLPEEQGRGRAFQDAEIYVYEEQSEKLTCVSCPQNGTAVTQGIQMGARAVEGIPYEVLSGQPRFFTTDGRYAFFSTKEALVPQDTNGITDTYEYDTQTGKLSLLSTGTGEDGAWFVEASAEGRDVFLVTRQQLSGWDPDKLIDLYDARADGGLPGPAAPPAPCSEDACQGTPIAPPTFNTASEFNGLGNPTPLTFTKLRTVTPARSQLQKRLVACKKLRPTHRRKQCEVKARKQRHSKKPTKPTSYHRPQKG
jgi:hypothetical protein